MLRPKKKTLIWAKENLISLEDIYKTKLISENDFQRWIDQCISIYWIDHAQMLGGLFNQEYINEISAILNCEPTDLENVRKLSCQLKQLSNWVKNRPNSEDFELAKNAYALAALFRGKYHDYIAQSSNLKIMQHPFRRYIYSKSKEEIEFIPTNSEIYLTSLLLTTGFAEKNVKNRIELWSENLIKARELIRLQGIDLSQKTNESIARNHIISIFKQNHFRTYSRKAADQLEFVASLLIGGFSFGLCEWAKLPSIAELIMTSGTVVGAKRTIGKSIGKNIAEKYTSTKRHLNELTESLPGRLIGNWSNSNNTNTSIPKK